jgi:hypothetical protein
MVAAALRFNWGLALPGLAAAATPGALAGIVHPDQIAEVRSTAQAVLAAVPAPRQPPSQTAVFNAFREFDREVSGQLDVQHNIDDNVFLDIGAAGDRRRLSQQADKGRRTRRSGQSQKRRSRLTAGHLPGQRLSG